MVMLWSVFTLSRGTQITKAMAAMSVSLTKEVNYNSYVRGHQYGGHDVKCKHFIMLNKDFITFESANEILNYYH